MTTDAIADIATPQSSFGGLLSPVEIRRLRRPSAVRLVRDLALIWLQILSALALFAVWPNPLTSAKG